MLSGGDAFRFVAVLTVAVVVVGGSVEALVDGHDFASTWDGIWWAVVTVTTVGYGDLYPRSVDGRIIGMVVMIVGVGFLSVLTAALASVFVKTDRAPELKEITDALKRLELELADLKRQFTSD